MQSYEDLTWFDPEQSFYGEKWDLAWRFGQSAGRASAKQEWAEVAPALEALWLDLGDGKSWYEARPAIYAAWRVANNQLKPRVRAS